MRNRTKAKTSQKDYNKEIDEIIKGINSNFFEIISKYVPKFFVKKVLLEEFDKEKVAPVLEICDLITEKLSISSLYIMGVHLLSTAGVGIIVSFFKNKE